MSSHNDCTIIELGPNEKIPFRYHHVALTTVPVDEIRYFLILFLHFLAFQTSSITPQPLYRDYCIARALCRTRLTRLYRPRRMKCSHRFVRWRLIRRTIVWLQSSISTTFLSSRGQSLKVAEYRLIYQQAPLLRPYHSAISLASAHRARRNLACRYPRPTVKIGPGADLVTG